MHLYLHLCLCLYFCVFLPINVELERTCLMAEQLPPPCFFLLYNLDNLDNLFKQKTNGTLFVAGFKTLAGGLWCHGQPDAKMVSGE